MCCTHLLPLVALRVVRLDLAEVLLTVVAADRVETIAQQTHADRVTCRADGRHLRPRVRLGVVPVT